MSVKCSLTYPLIDFVFQSWFLKMKISVTFVTAIAQLTSYFCTNKK